MAPVAGLTRDDVLRAIRAHSSGPFALNLGAPHRTAQITFDGTTWSLHAMVADPAKVAAESEARLSAGRSFMPEHVVMLQEAQLPVLTETDRAAFLAALATWPWAQGGPQL